MFYPIMILSIAVNLLLTAIVILFFVKLKLIEKRYSNFIANFNKNENIEEVFEKYTKMVNIVNEDNKIIKANYLNLEHDLRRMYSEGWNS